MKKVLVIIDMQNDFIDGALGNKECREVVPAVVDAVNNGGYTDIILTRDTHGENYLNTQEGRKLPVVHCIKGSDGWQINSEIMAAVDKFYEEIRHNKNISYDNNSDNSVLKDEKNADSDVQIKESADIKPVIIDKPTFASMELGEVLSGLVKEGDVVDFCGVCTAICVISNLSIAKASIPEVTVRLLQNATACVTPESREAAIKTAGMIQVELV